jgi:hypothetical protein
LKKNYQDFVDGFLQVPKDFFNCVKKMVFCLGIWPTIINRQIVTVFLIYMENCAAIRFSVYTENTIFSALLMALSSGFNFTKIIIFCQTSQKCLKSCFLIALYFFTLRAEIYQLLLWQLSLLAIFD